MADAAARPIPRRCPSEGTIRRPRRGLAALAGTQGFRRATQTAIAGFIAWLVVSRVEGSTSPEALCPFGGLETLIGFATGGVFVPHVHLSNVVLAVAALLTAFAARGAFCGWLCPFGFLQDVVAGVARTLEAHVPTLRAAMRTLRRRGARLAILDRPLRLLKYLVLAWAVLGAAAFGVMVFRDVDPWSALLEIGRGSAGIGFVVLVGVIVASFFVERAWCRYACPLGAATGLVSRFSPVRLERIENACSSCGACSKACPMGIDLLAARRVTSQDCVGCLECVEACPRAGALELRAGLPILSVS
ncbi:MAG TPA: 4Fe-4S binding protein [Candidatus Limnocylindrales bacterium]|nr:4Fe-4S binding protein [Candidatus Limnocylindrales bacterium]